jgi:uncharacterized protein RhaS with RHS repeats
VLVYLVHRYYDPKTGEFLSVDPDVATTHQPYQYAGDDPVNTDDPSGMSSRLQPKQWSQSEQKAVNEKNNGEPYTEKSYKSAMTKAKFNQKNGWTDTGEERQPSGTPMRNNQKRGGSSNRSGTGPDPCETSTSGSGSAVLVDCAAPDPDPFGGGEGDPDPVFPDASYSQYGSTCVFGDKQGIWV